MRLSALASLVLLPASVFGQSSSASASASAGAGGNETAATNPQAYLQAVLAALTQANLTSLVGVATGIANTTEGLALLTSLSVGNKTVFAPSNTAFANVSEDVSSNTTLLTQILSYHILNNTYLPAGVATAPNHTIARSLLRGGGYSLPGNFSAPLVLGKNSTNGTSFEINQASDNVSTTGPVGAANLQVYIIDEVLTLPPTIGQVATTLFPSLAGVIGQTGLLDPLSASQGVTIFAPNDAAILGVTQALGQLNSTQISTILANHVINGTVAYSNQLASANYTSAAGQPFTFTSNSTGTFVSSGGSIARVVQSDVIVSNGVIHIIDGVLVNPGANPEAAASAYSSATAAAATSVEATTPVTATSTAAPSGTGGPATTSGAASSAGQVVSSKGLVGGLVGFVSILGTAIMGGGLLLL
ncbi:hypothetical protein IAR55_004441 [Kwoniella newhampshirensis]|uniref:FAS1 domain-containing protein n=1 Tax=Kwoniella newhampshirensis TaxID=1651941 RepID=A0AAW0YKV8_9TREE